MGNLTFLQEAFLKAPIDARLVADDTGVPIVIKFNKVAGTTAARAVGLVGISTNGDVMFFVGSTAAAATLDASISGAATGRIDVSNASYDTMGEVVDRINSFSAASGWVAMLRDSLRSHSSNDTLLARGRTTTGVQSTTGALIYWDTSQHSILALQIGRRRTLADAPLEGWQPILRSFQARADLVSEAPTAHLYKRSGTVETLVQTWGMADDTELSKDLALGQLGAGIRGPVGGELILTVDPGTAAAGWSGGYLALTEQIVDVHDLMS